MECVQLWDWWAPCRIRESNMICVQHEMAVKLTNHIFSPNLLAV